MSLSTRLAERGIIVNGRTPTDVLAAEASRIAQDARDLGRLVADTTDVPACLPAREAALRLEGLADVLEASDGPTDDRGTDGTHADRERQGARDAGTVG